MFWSLLINSLLASIVYAQDCTLTVPANPLTATGLATPYQVSGCSQRADASSFVECAIYNNAGTIEIYAPLVVDEGDRLNIDFVPPVAATVPNGATVACWFGSNGDSLTLTGPGAAGCTNGLDGSIFGQFAHCSGDKFMAKALADAKTGILKVPPLGTATNGDPATGTVCPCTRDFRIVDQDQSDNVVSTFLILGGHVLSQNTAAQAAKGNSTLISNGSDNGLVDVILDPVLGCTPWKEKTVTTAAGTTAALALNELQAAMFPPKIPALVPLTDPMVLVNNEPSLQKTNLYRAGVGQPRAATNADADGVTYCKNFAIAGIFIQNNMNLFSGNPSPAVGTANNLYTFMAQRFGASLTNLNCLQDLNISQPVTMTTDANGVVTTANINLIQLQQIMDGMAVSSTTTVPASKSLTTVSKVSSVSVPDRVSSVSAPGNIVSISSVAGAGARASSKPSTLAKVTKPVSSLPPVIHSSLIAAASSVVAAISSSIAVAGSGGMAPSKVLSSTTALPSCASNLYQQLANGLVKNTKTDQFYFPIPPEFAQFLGGA